MELLERYFDNAFDAPDGIKKLRELILTLAMQGKLVPQDPNDQPASVLLKEIEAEKKRLVKQGKIKEPKPLPPVGDDEMPYVLPERWEWVKLRQICHDWGQQTPSTRFTYNDVGSIDNNRGTISSDTQVLESDVAPSRARKIVRKGTIIYSTVRPYLLNAAVVDKDFTPNAIVSTAFAILHPYSGVDGRYIYFFLRSPFFVRYVEANQKGIAYPAINDGDLFAGDFPLPPAAEQQRIVAKIDELRKRCDALEKLRAERDAKRLAVNSAAVRQLVNGSDTDARIQARDFLGQHFGELYSVKENVTELRKVILKLAVMGKLVPQHPKDQPASELLKQIEAEKKRLVKAGQIRESKPLPAITPEELPYQIPESWNWIRLGEAGAFERGRSKHRPRNDRRLFDDGTYPFVQTGDVSRSKQTGNQIQTCGSYYNEVGLKQSRLWKKGTLCITIAANIAETGFLGMDACVPDSVVVFLGVDHALEQLVKMFIDVAKDDLEHFAPSTAQKNINLGIINQLLFPLPPLKEQHRIVSQFNVLMAKCDELELCISTSRKKQDELLNAMMAQYGG